MLTRFDIPKFAKSRDQKIGSRYARLYGKSGTVYFVTEVPKQSIVAFRNCVLIAESRGAVVGAWHSDKDTAFVSSSGHLNDIENHSGTVVRWFVYFLGDFSACVTQDLVSDPVPQNVHRSHELYSPVKMAA